MTDAKLEPVASVSHWQRMSISWLFWLTITLVFTCKSFRAWNLSK